MLSFGERLRLARERKGLTQMDVYRAIGLNNKSLSRYENGTTAPDPDTVRDLIRLYDVSSDYILGLSNEMGTACPPSGSSLTPPKVSEDAALLIELVYSIVAVAERLGDTVDVAMSTYAHLYPNKMEQVAADLNRQMVPKNETPAAVISELEKVEKEHKKIKTVRFWYAFANEKPRNPVFMLVSGFYHAIPIR